LHFKNFDVYEGEFKFDNFDGCGVLKLKRGKKGSYEGFFKNGEKDGKGTLKDEKGNVY
jgi:hypothetical protein